ncbi:MAG: DUF4149 domain-containing protein [Ignavibacteria bacterium]|nr:DUF4149 domain-containing protein [Ignavibacteria bacterium]
MEFEFLNRVSFFLQILSLVIWVGGSILISVIITPYSFKAFSKKEDAGNFVGQILERFDYFIIISIFIFLLAILIELVNSARNPILKSQFQIHLILFSIMTLLAAVSRLVIRPLMKNAKKKITLVKIQEEKNPFKRRFSVFHGISYSIFIINIVLGLILIFLNQF